MNTGKLVALGLLFCSLCCGENSHRWAFLAGKEIPARKHRPWHWARPVAGFPEMDNCYYMGDGIYRGAQPTASMWEKVGKLGIRTAVNLRWLHADGENAVQQGIDYQRIQMKAWAPTDEHMVEFLRLATDSRRKPMFVYCYTGADRSALVCAVYRVVVQGWGKEDAIDEMLNSGFHEILKDTYEKYIRDMDADALRRQAGLTAIPFLAGGATVYRPATVPEPQTLGSQ